MESTLSSCTVNTAQMLKEARMNTSLVFPLRKSNNNPVQHPETPMSLISVFCLSHKLNVPKSNTALI